MLRTFRGKRTPIARPGLVGVWLSVIAVTTVFFPAQSEPASSEGSAAVEARLDALRARLPQVRGDSAEMALLMAEVESEIHRIDVFSPSIRALPEDVLSSAIALSADANFYAPGSQTREHQALFDERDRRGGIAPVDVDDLHRTLVADRRWEDAKALAERFPGVELQAIPNRVRVDATIPSNGPFTWRVAGNGEEIVRQTVAWPKGAALLVISHPRCGFSRQLLHTLESDAELEAALPPFRLLLAPTFGTFDFQGVHSWNREHPRFLHELVDRPVQWDAWVKNWQTPQLIFLVDGVVRERVVGWPTEGRRAETMAAMKRIEALAPAREE